jgi:hypothetical protein
VYIGHTAIFQLHRLSILKGERFCNDSNASLSLELNAMRGHRWGGARPPPIWQGFVEGALTFLYCHLVNICSGSILKLNHLPFKKLLSCGGRSRKK